MMRAQLFESFLEMGRRALPICPQQYNTVQMKLANPDLCGTYSRVDGTFIRD